MLTPTDLEQIYKPILTTNGCKTRWSKHQEGITLNLHYSFGDGRDLNTFKTQAGSGIYQLNNLHTFSAIEKNLTLTAMRLIEKFANVKFTENPKSWNLFFLKSGNIAGPTVGYTTLHKDKISPNCVWMQNQRFIVISDAFSDNNIIENRWYSLLYVIIHELLHGLGFQDTYNRLPNNIPDSQAYSIMNYERCEYIEEWFLGFFKYYSCKNLTRINPSSIDINILQDIYGESNYQSTEKVINLTEHLAKLEYLYPPSFTGNTIETLVTYQVDMLMLKKYPYDAILNLNQGPDYRSQFRNHSMELLGEISNIYIDGNNDNTIVLNEGDNVVDLVNSHGKDTVVTFSEMSAHDIIKGFSSRDQLVLEYEAAIPDFRIFQRGNNSIIFFGKDNYLFLPNTNATEVHKQITFSKVTAETALYQKQTILPSDYTMLDTASILFRSTTVSSVISLSLNSFNHLLRAKNYSESQIYWFNKALFFMGNLYFGSTFANSIALAANYCVTQGLIKIGVPSYYARNIGFGLDIITSTFLSNYVFTTPHTSKATPSKIVIGVIGGLTGTVVGGILSNVGLFAVQKIRDTMQSNRPSAENKFMKLV